MNIKDRISAQIELMGTRWIAKHSFHNCHCWGVDSILFDDASGNVLRVFVAHEDHQLWSQEPFMVGLHPHRTKLAITVLQGNISNLVDGYKYQHMYVMSCELKKFYWHSPIVDQTHIGYFADMKESREFQIYSREIGIDETCRLDAFEMHTIFVPRGKSAIWAVEELEADTHYEPITWSNDDLVKFSGRHLYRRMTPQSLGPVLAKVRSAIA